MSYIRLAGMDGYLRTEGATRTVFAPTDKAFEAMREESIGGQIINSNKELTNVSIIKFA